MRVLGICGSLRLGSYNRVLLQAAALEFPPGARLQVFEGLEDLPAYNQDVDIEPAPPAVRRLRKAIADADALLFATPEYNASVPGVLKNALDWASRPFPDNCLRSKRVAVVGASTSIFGAVWAQAELRKILTAAGAEVAQSELPVAAAHQAFGADGRIVDAALCKALAAVVKELVEESSERAA